MKSEKTANTELVDEVIDALLNPAFDADHHHQHVAAIKEYRERQPYDPADDELRQAHDVFLARRGIDPLSFTLNPDLAAVRIADQLKGRMPRWPTHLYHGTTSRQLLSIARTGLQPAFARSRWNRRVGTDHLGKGVFFTTSWRTAFHWALAHTLRRDGSPKTGHQEAVVRVLAEPLAYTKYTFARTEDCVIVEGSVELNGAYYLVGDLKGIPCWQPLDEALQLGSVYPPLGF